MRPPPAQLPAVESAKWHSRRNWDGLGYVRVRTLANPGWHRDLDWLIRLLESYRPSDMGAKRDLIDAAIHAGKEYRALLKRGAVGDPEFEARAGQQWDAVLAPLDEFLELIQRDHLRAVRQAGASGPGVPDPDS